MDENLRFKEIMAQKWAGTGEEMILMPYAKNLEYKDGELSLTLELFNEDLETEVTIKMTVADALKEVLDKVSV